MNFASQPLLTKLDAGFEIVWEKIMPGSQANYASSKLSTSPDGRLIAIAGMRDVRILDAEAEHVLHIVEHGPWGWVLGAACFFSKDGKSIWYVLPGEGDDNDTIQVMDAVTFEVIATQPLMDRHQRVYTFHATPDAGIILLEISAGQEASGIRIVPAGGYRYPEPGSRLRRRHFRQLRAFGQGILGRAAE